MKRLVIKQDSLTNLPGVESVLKKALYEANEALNKINSVQKKD